MTKSLYFPPTRPLIVLVAFEGAQLLDIAGPSEVFAAAAVLEGHAGCDIRVASVQGTPIATSAGVTLQTERLTSLSDRAIDTLIVCGGPDDAIKAAIHSRPLRRWLREEAPKVRRLASVCSGVFVLAAAGLTENRKVTTHWSAADRLQEAFADLTVDADALFVRDGALWTSGGVTAGIDMALAMVAEDHGSALAQAVAQQLVLSVRRPGRQSQFSPLLAAQKPGAEAFADLIVWIWRNLDKRLDGAMLAAEAGLSERSFQRKFVRATGLTPAAFVERVRVDQARSLLGAGTPLKTIAAQVGLGSTTRLAAAFQRQLEMTPQDYRAVHGG
ncbi:MAG: DJ-1/PfpI family protein [Alphaproteobacteria bacterium]